jgi:hypothetical protein
MFFLNDVSAKAAHNALTTIDALKSIACTQIQSDTSVLISSGGDALSKRQEIGSRSPTQLALSHAADSLTVQVALPADWMVPHWRANHAVFSSSKEQSLLSFFSRPSVIRDKDSDSTQSDSLPVHVLQKRKEPHNAPQPSPNFSNALNLISAEASDTICILERNPHAYSACPACTYANDVCLRRCEICDTPLSPFMDAANSRVFSKTFAPSPSRSPRQQHSSKTNLQRMFSRQLEQGASLEQVVYAPPFTSSKVRNFLMLLTNYISRFILFHLLSCSGTKYPARKRVL